MIIAGLDLQKAGSSCFVLVEASCRDVKGLQDCFRQWFNAATLGFCLPVLPSSCSATS